VLFQCNSRFLQPKKISFFNLKGEIERCIERLELGLGPLGSESFVGPARDGADGSKSKVVGRAPSIDNVV
jgi:hypothetical protein